MEDRHQPTSRRSKRSARRGKHSKQSAGPDPEKLTEAALSEAALSYLNRYDASVRQLRRVLLRRIERYGDESDASSVRKRIDALLERFVESKLLDDNRFARGFAQAARQRGASALKIRQKLHQRGIEPTIIDEALLALEEDELDDSTAAQAFARKKRLSSRYDLTDPRQRNKALGALARQGFSFSVAQDALAACEAGEGET